MSDRLSLTLLFIFVSLLSACGSGSASAPAQAVKPPLSAEAAIGKALFFDTSLSNPAGQSCASCHSPQHGFAEPDRQLPVSQGANPAHFGNRNAPSLAYAAYSPAFHFDSAEGLYIGGQFVDGRAATAEEQAIQPLLNPIEMNNASVDELLIKLRRASYAAEIRRVYGEQALLDGVRAASVLGRAIAAYERSPEVVPFSSKYDGYLAGRVRLSAQELRGLRVFEDEKQGNCAACHPSARGEDGSAPLFTDFSYDNLGVPVNRNNPYLGMPASFNPEGQDYRDKGLGAVLHKREEEGKFKVPGLRNIALTAPYMHNGVFTSLEEVVAFYNRRDSDPRWGAAEIAANVNRDELGDLKLSEQQRADLVAFLHTLSDGYTE